MPAKPTTTTTVAPRPPSGPSPVERRAKVGVAIDLLGKGLGLYAGKVLTEGNEWKAIGEGIMADLPPEVARAFDGALIAASGYIADYFAERP
jgi:hypothetical protein